MALEPRTPGSETGIIVHDRLFKVSSGRALLQKGLELAEFGRIIDYASKSTTSGSVLSDVYSRKAFRLVAVII